METRPHRIAEVAQVVSQAVPPVVALRGAPSICLRHIDRRGNPSSSPRCLPSEVAQAIPQQQTAEVASAPFPKLGNTGVASVHPSQIGKGLPKSKLFGDLCEGCFRGSNQSRGRYIGDYAEKWHTISPKSLPKNRILEMVYVSVQPQFPRRGKTIFHFRPPPLSAEAHPKSSPLPTSPSKLGGLCVRFRRGKQGRKPLFPRALSIFGILRLCPKEKTLEEAFLLLLRFSSVASVLTSVEIAFAFWAI